MQRTINGGERAPKYGSERTVYLAPELVKMLGAHVAAHAPGDDMNRWMFPGACENDTVSYDMAGHRWSVARSRAGVPATVRLHDLRHFYASNLIAQGCDVVTVQRALGHASASVTLSTYAHLWPSAEDRTRAAAAAILGEAFPDVPTVRQGLGHET